MRIRQLSRVGPVTVMPGDTIVLTWTDEQGITHPVLEDEITEMRSVDHAAIFDLESGDIPGFTGFGGAFLTKD